MLSILSGVQISIQQVIMIHGTRHSTHRYNHKKIKKLHLDNHRYSDIVTSFYLKLKLISKYLNFQNIIKGAHHE